MKYLVETTGNFMLFDFFASQEVQAHRPTVVKATQFIENHLGKKLKKLDALTDEASDTGLAKAKNAEELKAAIDALPRHENVKPKAAARPKE